MDNIASNITEYRRKAGLTQKDLGDMLNISPQAISKWENGQAEPDTATIKKLCSIFKISTDELLGVAEEDNSARKEPAPAGDTQPAPAVHYVEQKIINGYCEDCKKPVGLNEYVVVHTGKGAGIQHIYCNECNRKRMMYDAIRQNDEYKSKNKKSIIWGALAGIGVLAVLAAIMAFDKNDPMWLRALIPIIAGIGYFAFVMQVFWDGVVIDVFSFFLKSFSLPGVIFTLDLDGVIFLVAFKVIGAILVGLLSALWFLIGLIVTPLIALVVLPFASTSRAREGKRLAERVKTTTAAVEADRAAAAKSEAAATV